MVQEDIFPDKEISVKTTDDISGAIVGTGNRNNNDTHVPKVLADELLDELFLNLIANAAKYTDSNYVPVEITLDKEEDASSNRAKRLKITISDFGHGIPDNLKDKIFGRYDPITPSNISEGSGLSLFIVKKLVDDYKGEIYVQNRVPGDFSKGTIFTVLLPLAVS
jgi:signal transduction histidine kinase